MLNIAFGILLGYILIQLLPLFLYVIIWIIKYVVPAIIAITLIVLLYTHPKEAQNLLISFSDTVFFYLLGIAGFLWLLWNIFPPFFKKIKFEYKLMNKIGLKNFVYMRCKKKFEIWMEIFWLGLACTAFVAVIIHSFFQIIEKI